MDCRWVEDRIVAFQDDELSRSEQSVIEEHLTACTACSGLHHSLMLVSPEPCLSVPPEVQRRLELAVDLALDHAFAEQWAPAEPGRVERSRRWLRRDRDLSNGAMLAYAAVLAICIGWGMSNWIAVQSLQLEPVGIARTDVQGTVSGDHYQPASYAIDEDQGDQHNDWR